jgi:hypothetical protein
MGIEPLTKAISLDNTLTITGLNPPNGRIIQDNWSPAPGKIIGATAKSQRMWILHVDFAGLFPLSYGPKYFKSLLLVNYIFLVVFNMNGGWD